MLGHKWREMRIEDKEGTYTIQVCGEGDRFGIVKDVPSKLLTCSKCGKILMQCKRCNMIKCNCGVG